MSNFGAPNPPTPPGQASPPPFGGQPSPPPPPFAPQAPPPPPQWPPNQAPGYMPQGYVPAPVGQKPPRPAITAACLVIVAGAVLAVIGCLLKWFELRGGGESISANGFDIQDFNDGTFDSLKFPAPGEAIVVFAVIAAAFGVAMLLAKRILGLAITCIVCGAFLVLFAAGDLGNASDVKSLVDLGDAEFSYGPGMYVVLVGGIATLVGGIMATAKRRR